MNRSTLFPTILLTGLLLSSGCSRPRNAEPADTNTEAPPVASKAESVPPPGYSLTLRVIVDPTPDDAVSSESPK
jgi:hypothetical protein